MGFYLKHKHYSDLRAAVPEYTQCNTERHCWETIYKKLSRKHSIIGYFIFIMALIKITNWKVR